MQAYRLETQVQRDGQLTLHDLPLTAGDAVEVIILVHSPKLVRDQSYPLRGLPIDYRQPTDPVADEAWEAIK